VLLVDKYGLPIESSGNLKQNFSGILSAIARNASSIGNILEKP